MVQIIEKSKFSNFKFQISNFGTCHAQDLTFSAHHPTLYNCDECVAADLCGGDSH